MKKCFRLLSFALTLCLAMSLFSVSAWPAGSQEAGMTVYLRVESGVEGAEKRRVGTGSMFRIVILQKRREGVWVVQMPRTTKRKAELDVGRA